MCSRVNQRGDVTVTIDQFIINFKNCKPSWETNDRSGKDICSFFDQQGDIGKMPASKEETLPKRDKEYETSNLQKKKAKVLKKSLKRWSDSWAVRKMPIKTIRRCLFASIGLVLVRQLDDANHWQDVWLQELWWWVSGDVDQSKCFGKQSGRSESKWQSASSLTQQVCSSVHVCKKFSQRSNRRPSVKVSTEGLLRACRTGSNLGVHLWGTKGVPPGGCPPWGTTQQ